MKGANRYMKIFLAVFQENISFGAIWSVEAILYCVIGHGQNWARPLLGLGSLNSQDMISQVNI